MQVISDDSEFEVELKKLKKLQEEKIKNKKKRIEEF